MKGLQKVPTSNKTSKISGSQIPSMLKVGVEKTTTPFHDLGNKARLENPTCRPFLTSHQLMNFSFDKLYPTWITIVVIALIIQIKVDI